MRHLTVLIVAGIVATLGCGFGVVAAATGGAPPVDTVVEVTGGTG